MKIIDFVEYQLTELENSKDEYKLDDNIMSQMKNSVCTADKEEAKTIVTYFINDLIRLADNDQLHSSTYGMKNLAHEPSFRFNVPKERDIINCSNEAMPSSGRFIFLPFYIDRDSFNNIMSAIEETGIFDTYREYNEQLNSDTIRFEILPEKLDAYKTSHSDTIINK